MAAALVMRAAAPGEAEALTELAVRSKAYWGYSAGFMRTVRGELAVSETRIAGDEDEIVVALHGGTIVGFYGLLRISESVLELDSLFVDPGSMGTGVGRALVEHASARAVALGAERILVQSDPYAEAFYLALGARRIGVRESGSIPGRFLPELELRPRPACRGGVSPPEASPAAES